MTCVIYFKSLDTLGSFSDDQVFTLLTAQTAGAIMEAEGSGGVAEGIETPTYPHCML